PLSAARNQSLPPASTTTSRSPSPSTSPTATDLAGVVKVTCCRTVRPPSALPTTDTAAPAATRPTSPSPSVSASARAVAVADSSRGAMPKAGVQAFRQVPDEQTSPCSQALEQEPQCFSSLGMQPPQNSSPKAHPGRTPPPVPPVAIPPVPPEPPP